MTHRSSWIRSSFISLSIAFLCLLAAARTTAAQAGTVRAEQKISATEGGFGGDLDIVDVFGCSVTALGDLNGDGVGDLAVGARGDDDGDTDQGAVWILFLNADGTVAAEQKISETQGGFGGELDGARFAFSVAALGDLDGDGITELAVSAFLDDDGGPNRGAVWILFLNADGTVASEQKASETFSGDIEPSDFFGFPIAGLGDLDGDGNGDLAVGARGDDDGPGFNTNRGAVWILFLDDDGTVAFEQKVSATQGGFDGVLDPLDAFGSAVAGLGDLDGDGTEDLAVCAQGDDGVWILFLNADGTVASEQKASETFSGDIEPSDFFGFPIAGLGDLDGDGNGDLALGAFGDDDGGGAFSNRGAVWIFFLNDDGTVASEQKISDTQGGFGGDLDDSEDFGVSVAALGDLDGDGVTELAVGADSDNDGGVEQGAVWVLFLEGCVTLDFEREDDFETALVNGQHVDTEFGELVTLSSSGPNAGLGIFDSTPGGPNDPSQDRDLLVGTGNVLILQTENLPPDVNDVFPRPNDDEDGGTMRFDLERAVEAKSLRLIDVDAGDGPTAVVLTDGADRARTYTVPSNWTGDLLLAQPGHRVLDLTTLAPQPGFGSIATASEVAGFDPTGVVRIEVTLDGSGAIDDLVWCPTELPQAQVSERNGSGANAVRLTSLSLPVLGSTWNAELDCAAFGTGLATLDVRGAALSGRPTPYGELLIDGPLVQRTVGPFAGSARTLGWDLPNDLALCGLELHAQGLCSGTSFVRGKTLRRSAWLSNAIDLVLGY